MNGKKIRLEKQSDAWSMPFMWADGTLSETLGICGSSTALVADTSKKLSSIIIRVGAREHKDVSVYTAQEAIKKNDRTSFLRICLLIRTHKMYIIYDSHTSMVAHEYQQLFACKIKPFPKKNGWFYYLKSFSSSK